MTPKRVCQSINNILDYLRSVGLVVDYRHVSDRKKENTEVSFNNANLVSEYRNLSYPKVHAAIAELRMYTARFRDDAFVQLQYQFDKNKLVKHRLAFLPPPQASWIVVKSQPGSKPLDLDKILEQYSGGRQLRFDFDVSESIHVNVWHPKSHLTLIDNDSCRIPLTSAVSPYWFFHFIVNNFYSSNQEDFTSSLPRLKGDLPLTITQEEKQIPHLVLPQHG